MQHIIFVALAPIAVAVVLLIAGVAWHRRDTPPAFALLWLVLITLGWLVSNTLELIVTSPTATLRWARLTYAFIAAEPLAWLIFSLQYVGRREWLRPSRLVPLALVPATTAVIALSGAGDGLLWADYRLVPVDGLLHMQTVAYGPWFWINTFYGYTCVLLGAGLILAHYVRSSQLYRRQVSWVVLGALSVVAVNAAFVFRLIPGWRKDYSPLALAFAGLLFAVGIFRHRLLDLWPIGRNQLVETIRDGLVVIDERGRIVDVNPAARDIVGDGGRPVIGAPLADVLPAASAALGSSEAEGVDGDITVETEDGARHYELRASDITERRGRRLGRLVVLHDVTERREATRRLRHQERLAAVGQLAGGIAHDFNNLLGSIMLHAQLAQREGGELPLVVRDSLDVIVEEARGGGDLVGQILDFSRSAMMESGPLDLGSLVEDVARVLRRTIREDISVVVEAPPHPCVVAADSTRLRQMLLNLATNARDAMPEGGELRMTLACSDSASWSRGPRTGALDRGGPGEDGRGGPAERGPSGGGPIEGGPIGGWAHLVVSDTGTGMDAGTQEHLFEPFFTTKEPDRGTGLGLAQVYGIVNQHGGDIRVETAPGEGSSFHIFLPLCHDAVPAPEEDDAAYEPMGKGETILLVEDEDSLREASREALTGLGYRVLTAANAREALRSLNGHRVDLVITDLVMPEMGGEALAEALGRRLPGVPVLAVTGHAIDGDGERLRALGFDDVLRKPFDVPELARAVRRKLSARE